MTKILMKTEGTKKEMIEKDIIHMENTIFQDIKNMHLIDFEEKVTENGTTNLFAEINILHNSDLEKINELLSNLQNLTNEIKLKLLID